MAKGGGNKVLSGRAARLVWLVVLGIALLIGSAFWKAWGTRRALEEEVETLKPVATAMAREQETLKTQLEYVQSDEYVESWARTHARMAKPGDTLVIPVSVSSTPTPEPEAATTPVPDAPEAPFWMRWWRALTGE